MGLNLSIEGTTPESVDEASDRKRFEDFAKRCNLRMPRGTTAIDWGVREAVSVIGTLF